MAIGEKLSELLEQKKIKPGTLARMTGVPKTTVYSIINRNNKNVDFSTMEKIATFLEVPTEYFYDKQAAFYYDSEDEPLDDGLLSSAGIMPMPKMKLVPLIGSIACGTPITAVENVEDMVSVPWDVPCDFVLRCKGDSMAPRLLDGDLVFIRQQPDVHDGQIAVIIHDGEATLKHVYHIPGVGVQLVAENPAYPPMVFTSANSDELRIVGLAISYQRAL